WRTRSNAVWMFITSLQHLQFETGRSFPVRPPHLAHGCCFQMLSCKCQMMSSQLSLGFDDHFERFCFGRVPEGFIGVEDVVEFEAMGNQELGVDSVRHDGPEQHRYGDGVDQPCGDGDVAVPQTLQVESYFLPMHPDVGNGAARRDNF